MNQNVCNFNKGSEKSEEKTQLNVPMSTPGLKCQSFEVHRVLIVTEDELTMHTIARQSSPREAGGEVAAFSPVSPDFYGASAATSGAKSTETFFKAQ